MLKKVETYIQKWDMLKKEDKIIVGVSGGADSICLLFVLLEIQKKIPFELVVVHVNHGLRGTQADAEEVYVKSICEKLKIPCVIYSENVELIAKNRKQSTEEAGRDVRREAFSKTMQLYGGNKIALAHHKNDSVETFFMNLSRGTGIKGLGGIRPIAGEYIRPLLCLERSEIEEYLKGNNILYCEDVTNAEDEYTRNRIRNHVIPYLQEQVNSQTVAHIDDAMRKLQEVQSFLEEETKKHYERCVRKEEGAYLVSAEELEKAPELIKPLIFKKVLLDLTEKEKDIGEIHLDSIQSLLDKQVGRQVNLPYEVEAKRVYDGILFQKKKDVNSEFPIFEITFEGGSKQQFMWRGKTIFCELLEKENNDACCPQKSGEKWFDYDIIAQGACFRTRRQGDYITIHPDGRTQKLKSFFVNEKIPQEKRDEIILLADGDHILWIEGFRTNCKYHVTKETKRILKIKVNEGEGYGRDN